MYLINKNIVYISLFMLVVVDAAFIVLLHCGQ